MAMASLRQRRVQVDEPLLEDVIQDVVKTDIKIKGHIQDIRNCSSSLEDLDSRNVTVQAELARQRQLLTLLEEAAMRPAPETEREQMQQQAQLYSQQLTSQLLQLRRANVAAQLSIERRESTELLGRRQTSAAAQQRRGKEQLANMSSQMTDNMMAINRQLADQVQRSRDTLDVLVNSSDKVGETHEELKNMGGVIGQSRRLLNKYGRRELTDTILFVLAFAFFFACVLYVMKKRLWGW